MKYLKIWTDFRETMSALSDAQKGRLFTAMLLYAETGEDVPLSGLERILWPAARQHIDRARDEYDRQQLCGRKGGRPKKLPFPGLYPDEEPDFLLPETEKKGSKGSERVEKGKKPIKDKDKDKEKENDKDNDNDHHHHLYDHHDDEEDGPVGSSLSQEDTDQQEDTSPREDLSLQEDPEEGQADSADMFPDPAPVRQNTGAEQPGLRKMEADDLWRCLPDPPKDSSPSADPLMDKSKRELSGLTDSHWRQLGAYRVLLDEALIDRAIDSAVAHGARSWAYVNRILENYVNAGIRSVAQAEAEDVKRRSRLASAQKPAYSTAGKNVSAKQYTQRDYTEEELEKQLGIPDLFAKEPPKWLEE